MYKQNAMKQVLISATIWIVAYIIQWLIEKRREHMNQNRNAVTNAVAKKLRRSYVMEIIYKKNE